MIEPRGDPRLAQEAMERRGGLAALRSSGGTRENLLERNLPPEKLVDREPDRGLCAAADLLQAGILPSALVGDVTFFGRGMRLRRVHSVQSSGALGSCVHPLPGRPP